jgi:threonine dehydrogenase-like Zn-dependent dehydrogenase
VHQTAIELLAAGQLKTDDLVSQRIPFAQAADAYRLIETQPEAVIKVVLIY